MVKRSRSKTARRIATRRDFEGATVVAKRLSNQPDRDTDAELRLKSLLKELDRYDDAVEDEADESPTDGYEDAEPRRRWSDDE